MTTITRKNYGTSGECFFISDMVLISSYTTFTPILLPISNNLFS
eukprot:UN07638